jgi:hypothetical protein
MNTHPAVLTTTPARINAGSSATDRGAFIDPERWRQAL